MAAFATAAAARAADSAPPSGARDEPRCRLLEAPAARGLLGGLELVLLRDCGETRASRAAAPGTNASGEIPLGGAEVLVNQPSLDLAAAFASHTQSETSLARSATTGTLCAGFNDSYHLLTEGTGFGGFSRSQGGGASWQDRGALGPGSAGNPSLVWRRADGSFYYAALHSGGIGLWRSADDCAHFSFLGLIHSGGGGDKEQLAVDNDPASPRYGRLYAVFTDFGAGGRIFASASADGGASWSVPAALSGAGETVQNAWPAVAPDGALYVAWTRWTSFPDGPFEIRLAKSADGGASFAPLASPLVDALPPRDAGASAACGRPALAGNLRHLPAPQLAAGAGGRLHLVYAADPDGLDAGDASDVFYRNSADGGASWSAPLPLAADATSDQFSPSLAIGAAGLVSVSWYDRRLDPANLEIDRYQRISFDRGASWGAETRLTGVSSPIRLDPELPACYHGDYDGQLAAPDEVVALWSDDRRIQDGHHDADVYSSRLPAPLFGDGFEAGDTSAWSAAFP